MSEAFYINYSWHGEHYSMGPYQTRRFAMAHINDVRCPGVTNVFLGTKGPQEANPPRKAVPITMQMELHS